MQVCKPGSVQFTSRYSDSIIYLELASLQASINLPSFVLCKHKLVRVTPLNKGLFGFSTSEVYPKLLLPIICVSSYLTFSTLLICKQNSGNFLWHLLLRIATHLVVNKQNTLCCPDFPHPSYLEGRDRTTCNFLKNFIQS